MHPLLLLIADARFPAGGHTQSVGVESAVHYGDVVDAPSLGRYLRGRLATTGVTEAAFAARTAAGPGGEPAGSFVARLDDELAARLLSPRQRMVNRQLGRQLLRVARRVVPSVAEGVVAGVAAGVAEGVVEAIVDEVADGVVQDVPHGVAADELIRALAAPPDGPLQPIAFGALVRAVGGTPLDAARVQLHHLVAAGTTAAVRLRGLDPLELTELAAGLATTIDGHAVEAARYADRPVAELPAWSGTLTEILAEDHGAWDGRLFAA